MALQNQTFMVRVISAVLLGLFAATSVRADSEPATTQPAKTGAFSITFTQRSPESEYSKLVQRIGLTRDALGQDYDLTQEPMVAYVPRNYDRKTPMGLIVQIFQDGSPDIYEPIRPILDDQHFIMIATRKDHRPLLNAVGLCFDTVFNLRQTYAIDPSRIYFIGLGQTEEPIGWSTGDLFMGDVYLWWVGFNRPIWGNAPLFQVNPPPELMSLVKPHVQILGWPAEDKTPDVNRWRAEVASSMRSDGFENVISAPVGHDQILEADWFRQTLQQLESVESHPVTTHPSPAAPPPDEPTRLLHLAQAYMSAGATDRAREKLNLLIQKYPDDPAAATARELLSQLNGQ